MIAEAAIDIAGYRDFQMDYELYEWAFAERQIDAVIRCG